MECLEAGLAANQTSGLNYDNILESVFVMFCYVKQRVFSLLLTDSGSLESTGKCIPVTQKKSIAKKKLCLYIAFNKRTNMHNKYELFKHKIDCWMANISKVPELYFYI